MSEKPMLQVDTVMKLDFNLVEKEETSKIQEDISCRLTTNRTDALMEDPIQIEDDTYSIFASSAKYQELYNMAQFYQKRNNERVDNKQLNLFPFSTEADIEVDP